MWNKNMQNGKKWRNSFKAQGSAHAMLRDLIKYIKEKKVMRVLHLILPGRGKGSEDILVYLYTWKAIFSPISYTICNKILSTIKYNNIIEYELYVLIQVGLRFNFV